jgi:gas vesicle protein
MLRTKFFMTLTGVAVAAAAAGCVVGLMVAPSSGKELRRRLAWKSGEWRSKAASRARFLEQAAARAREELRCRTDEWTKSAS